MRPLPTKAQTRNAGHGHGREGQRDQLGGAESRCERHVEHAPIADAVTLLHVGCSKHRLHLLLREMTNELRVGLLRRDPEADLLDIIHVVPYWPRGRYLELAPKYWATTRARIPEKELKVDIGDITVPPPLPPREQPASS